jgi:signal transduction histidine kinase
VSSEQSQLRLHRLLLLSAGAGYLGWWLFVRAALPEAFNPIVSRVAVVACFLAVYAVSHAWKAVARTLESWLGVCCSLATAHYFYLFDRNNADLNWVVGSYITVTAVCAILQTSRTLLLYSLFVASLSVGMLVRHQGGAYVVFLPGMLTSLLFANVGLRSRLRILGRLQETNAVAYRELTERKRAEAALVRANRDLESFSYSVAHDLRGPLRGIGGYSAVLLEDYGERLDEEGKHHLDRIAAGAETMGRLIDALLGLARLTRTELRRETVDLTQHAETIADQLRAAHPDRVVEFVNEAGVVAQGDAQLLLMLLDNLLGNAWKFTARTPSPRVTFGCIVKEEGAVYYVKDNGAGFDMAYAKKLFAPFHRLHRVADYPGTGIGLATVQRIVHRHDGLVWAEGTVDEGATFFFTLQAGAAPAGSSPTD